MRSSSPPVVLAAQQRGTGRITGIITNVESNQPMQGVRVTLLGTQQTVSSNPLGHYTLTGVTPGQWRIRASAIGYTPVIIDSIPVAEGQSVNADIAMRHQTVELEKIVVTGYGSLAKRDVTGAIGQVSADAIKQIPTTNAIEAIKGRVAGVDIVSSGYTPGAPCGFVSAASARSRRRTIRSTFLTASRWPAASAT